MHSKLWNQQIYIICLEKIDVPVAKPPWIWNHCITKISGQFWDIFSQTVEHIKFKLDRTYLHGGEHNPIAFQSAIMNFNRTAVKKVIDQFPDIFFITIWPINFKLGTNVFNERYRTRMILRGLSGISRSLQSKRSLRSKPIDQFPDISCN